jgi:hypothetical protein
MQKTIQKQCQHHGLTVYILEGRGTYRCRQCRSERVSQWRQANKEKLVAEFGGKCIICGYNRCVANMVFHHNDPAQKEFSISAKGHTIAYKFLKREAEKCTLLCCRCHGEVHAGLVSIPE